MNVLIAEDDACLRQTLVDALARRGWDVAVCGDGLGVLRAVQAQPPDALLLELALPGLDGLAVIGRLRAARVGVPVLLLTARSSVGDRVQALNAGADDLMCKPCDLDELSARLRALVRRATMQPAAVHCGRLRLERDSGAFYVGTQILGVTPREQTFLSTLIMRAGTVVPKDRLFREVFPFDTQASAQALDVVAHRVRRKLGGAGVVLVTVRGLGYILRAEPLRMAPPGHASPAGEVASGRTRE